MADDFKDIFKPDSDIGADTAAPEDKGTPRDDSGRFAAKQPEAESKAQTPALEAKAETSPEPKDDPSSSRMVPLSELLSEREKRKTEAKLREEAAAQSAAYQKLVEQLTQAQQRQHVPQPQAQQPVELPDPLTDPQGYAAYQQQVFNQQLLNERANNSEARARDKHGDAVVDTALKAAPPNVQQWAYHQRDPYGALIDWHKKQSFLSEVGPDPSAYRTKLEQEIRAKVLAELKAGNQQQTRFPGTLADATASGTAGANLTDEAVAKELFGTHRNRRA